MYFFFYVLPLFYIKGEIRSPFTTARGYKSLLVETELCFFKFSISFDSTVHNEYQNFISLFNTNSISEFLPRYRFLSGFLYSALICENLKIIPAANVLPVAIDIYRKLNSICDPLQKLNISNDLYILEVLKCVEKVFGKATKLQFDEQVTKFLSNDKYSIGLVHGDFHSRNLMQDLSGLTKIIDLDCCRLLGVREFDALYFALEQKWSCDGSFWIDTLSDCLNHSESDTEKCLSKFGVTFSKELALTFFLDRIGQEISLFNIEYSYNKMIPLINFLNKSNTYQK